MENFWSYFLGLCFPLFPGAGTETYHPLIYRDPHLSLYFTISFLRAFSFISSVVIFSNYAFSNTMMSLILLSKMNTHSVLSSTSNSFCNRYALLLSKRTPLIINSSMFLIIFLNPFFKISGSTLKFCILSGIMLIIKRHFEFIKCYI